MNLVNLGNGFYFMYMAIALVFFVVLVLLLKNRTYKTQHIVVSVILFLNLALHFAKIFFEPYASGYPSSLKHISFENICAVSAMLFPFIYLIKRQNVLHDYVFFIGIISGLLSLIYPTEALGRNAFSFDVIRFYICHIILIVVPLTSAAVGLYRPRLKMFWAMPLLFMAHELIIFVNEIVLIKAGIVQSTWAEFLDRGIRNNSFVFGLTPEFDAIKPLFDALTPNFLKTDVFGINGGVAFYMPVVWMFVPAFLFLCPIYVIISSPFWIADIVTKKRRDKLIYQTSGKKPTKQKKQKKEFFDLH